MRLGLCVAVLALLAGCASAPGAKRAEPPSAEPVAPAACSEERGPLLALVLSGGAARGFAHVGAIAELEAAGYSADIVVGTSAGAVVGALYAGGEGAASLHRIAADIREAELRDIVFPDRGFVRGDRLERFVNRRLGERTIEQLERRFAAVATDLETGDAVAFTRGDAGMAVRASSSIPGVFQPVRIRGRDYVDGGLSSPVPVRVARRMGAEVIVAIDATRRPDEAAPIATTLGIIVQAFAIMGRYVGLEERAEADVTIAPAEPRIGPLDFASRQDAMAAGEAAARAALPALRAAVERAEARRRVDCGQRSRAP